MITDNKEIARLIAQKSRKYFRKNPGSGIWGGLFPEQNKARIAMEHRGMEPIGSHIIPCVVEHLKLIGVISESVQIHGQRYRRKDDNGSVTASTRVLAYWKK